jgi:hypothetical protein
VVVREREMDEKGIELLMTAYESESYEMIAYLLRFGLSARRIWG